MVPGASHHCPRQAPVMPLILVITDVDTRPVHCQRHIYVYHFVYLRPTQAALEYSIGVAFRGGGGAAECLWLLLYLGRYIAGGLPFL